MNRLKTGDKVIVIAGKYKGKTGEIMKICEHNRVIVSGINMIKKSMKPNPQQNQPGGLIDKEAPVHASNVALHDGNKASRVGFRVEADNKKVRYYKTNNAMVSN